MGLLGVAFWTYGMNIWRDKSHNSFASPPGGKTRREQSETLNFGYRLNPRTVLDVLRQIPCAGSFWIKKFYQFSAAAYIISFLTMAWQMFLTNNESSSCVCEGKERALHTMIVWLWLCYPYTGNGGRPQGDGLIWMKTDLNMYSCCECRGFKRRRAFRAMSRKLHAYRCSLPHDLASARSISTFAYRLCSHHSTLV